MNRTRLVARRWLCLAAALWGIAWAAPVWAVDPTSCDVKTGASCLWKEGCDCDHDGYVINSSKSAKYCHLDKCPIDSDDKSATKLGIVSTNNADGDGWTKAYDCDDNDKCIGKACGVNTCTVVPPEPDNDKDGYPASKDCNDNDANVKPGAGMACCDCVVLADKAKAAALGCSGCPLSQPAVDAGSTDIGTDTSKPPGPDSSAIDVSTKDAATADTGAPDTGKPDQGGAAMPDQAEPIADAAQQDELADTGSVSWTPRGGYVGGGTAQHGAAPAPGCSAARVARVEGALTLALVALLFVARRLVRRRAPVAPWFALVLAALPLVSCVRVEPWQRQRLAHRCMVLGRNSGEQTLEQHAFQYREGAAGGFGGGGGGCGCN